MTTEEPPPAAVTQEAPPDDGGNLGAEPSSHDTCGQFPAAEVAATHETGVAEPDTKDE